MLLLPIAETLSCPAPAAAQERRLRLEIPAGSLQSSIALLAQATGVAIGWSGVLPAARVPLLRGVMSIDDALRRLLRGSGLVAKRVGPTAYRLVPAPREPRRRPEPAPRSAPGDVATRHQDSEADREIVVTAHKREQTLFDVPISVATVDLTTPHLGHLSPGTHDIALSIDGLSLTNLGPGRDRPFIRGVADSPFNGVSQSTVAIVLDEARITFDAPDPDLRLIDMERVELLKGPQGPLYGSGALGGVYHMVTAKPDLSATAASIRLAGQAIERGGAGGAAEAVVNLPLADGRLAVRGVGYVAQDGGWIDNIGVDRNANATRSSGGRVALRWQPDADWTFDASAVLQDANTEDSQYVTVSDKTVQRKATIAEPTDNDFKSYAATIEGRIGGLKLLGTSSYVDHRVDYTLDATEASALFGLSGPSRFVDDRTYSVQNHEVRISPLTSSAWLAGLSYLRAGSRNLTTVTDATRTIVAEDRDRRVIEVAAFGETTIGMAPRLEAILGLRASHTVTEDEAAERSGAGSKRVVKTIATPSLSVSWSASPQDFAYLRYARAVRPGGLAPSGTDFPRRFDSDELGTLDLGFRHEDDDEHLSFSASAFWTAWTHIQSDFLLPDGLVSTRNAGDGRILGVEVSGDWRPRPRLQLSAGGTVIDARLVRAEDGLKLDDRRLPVVPTFTGRLGASYRLTAGAWEPLISGQANYVGRSRLTFDPALDRGMGGYLLGAASVFATHDRVTIGARVDNLFNVREDTFAFGNPFIATRQYTPLQPRSLTVSVSRAW